MNLLKEVERNFCVVSDIEKVLDMDVLNTSDWDLFKNSWNKLGLDNFMNDGGQYRRRNFCKFRYHFDDNSLWIKEHDYYFQPENVNTLNGGIKRWFTPVTSEVFYNKVVNKLIKKMGKELSLLTDQKTWDVNFYQNRIIAEQGKEGKPSPEGIHKDGVKYSILLLIDRENINGGRNTIFNLDREPIFSHTLKKEGECIIFSDDQTYHFASSIEQVKPNIVGKRDLLVVEFY
ncbi:2OG-Fe dioxygenase family protein [Photobacterium angustum]|uniref:2OG-Fe dioxygenase family protein n=1 Tax=Photobacterium angustum TaxID=661 RepID=A0A2S7VJG6_PHOAN|nr:2OG-Fe dioxygenase family protein [Photobacterium angustum]PQJ62284.1 hypothetical protein BTO08_18770 [Photobacterium angustum]